MYTFPCFLALNPSTQLALPIVTHPLKSRTVIILELPPTKRNVIASL